MNTIVTRTQEKTVQVGAQTPSAVESQGLSRQNQRGADVQADPPILTLPTPDDTASILKQAFVHGEDGSRQQRSRLTPAPPNSAMPYTSTVALEMFC
ncbi:hypothetical protein cyc_05152 [Cyclospora cayetanensis]|uniref:Uncharacterized protein n=1 Tax=Cyclospora cayetanensis TaxID=88456 RepID=A0A1D3D2A3_9EIME|nr:hypothetical protein cyc_05152 [Cyclospora cayetanensis]